MAFWNKPDPDIDPTTGKPWEVLENTPKSQEATPEQIAWMQRQKEVMKAALKAGKSLEEAKAEAANTKSRR